MKCVKGNLNDKLYRKRLLYLVVLYAQLCNGARISEAVESVLKWLTTGVREIKVLARKIKIERLIIIPRELVDLRTTLQEITKKLVAKS